MNRYGVTEAKAEQLAEKMRQLGVRESDFTERFIRSQGPGGQNVNKVSTCVVLKHLPTGLEVRAQQERSQALNRFSARRRLLTKIENQKLGRRSEERKRIEKIRRQKRKRSKRAKEKMLANKKQRSQTKQLRARPSEDV